MKYKVGLVFSILLVMLTTGCVNYNASMKIKNDKSMDYVIVFMMNPEVYYNTDVTNEIEIMKINGFNVEEYTNGVFKGYRVSKEIDNIDKYSKTEDVIYSLSDLPNDGYIFKVKKGFIKNKYTANFVFDKAQYGTTTAVKQDLDIENYIEQNDNGTLANEDIFNVNKTTIKFNVILPNSALSNNATSALDSNRNLVWNITEDVQNISFEFELYNKYNVILTYVLIAVVVIVIFALMIKKRMTPSKGVKKIDIDVNSVANSTRQMIQNTDPSTQDDMQNKN